MVDELMDELPPGALVEPGALRRRTSAALSPRRGAPPAS